MSLAWSGRMYLPYVLTYKHTFPSHLPSDRPVSIKISGNMAQTPSTVFPKQFQDALAAADSKYSPSAPCPRSNDQAQRITPGFFTLPQELRDLIYDELWKFTPCIQLTAQGSQPSTLELKYGACNYGSCPGLPPWLLASKAILQQGLRQLFQHAIWQWSLFRNCTSSVYAKRNSLAGLSTATNLYIRGHNNPPTPFQEVCSIDYRNHPCRYILPLLSSNLRMLTLGLSVRKRAWCTVILDLSRLCSTRLYLDKLVVLIRFSVWSELIQECAGCYATFLDTARMEVFRLGNAWVGRSSSMQLKEEFKWRRLTAACVSNVTVHKHKIRFEVDRVEE
jgi:hypothetical protein